MIGVRRSGLKCRFCFSLDKVTLIIFFTVGVGSYIVSYKTVAL